MSVADETSQPPAPLCWCCGNQFEEHDLLRLGSHPEAAVCFNCARFLHRRAVGQEDQRRTTLAGRIRTGITGVREWIIAHNWHRLPLLGSLLQRLDRHLP
ncbi:hypothetical protein EV645_4761 [Kribbella rubisoli]|uniref:Uncharacterized protein n=1 Tax=Kribbella rubisoli TaxID=3075929 RepID=A0A4Q7WU27_9ACTN|nr:hypothetical protein [Kribbella rubisoli]RZU13904.1 hypothetical protein EV645_4761 [Kribbella rubisoli]